MGRDRAEPEAARVRARHGLEGTDYAAIARGFGAHGEHVVAPEEVAGALERALAAGGPAVIDARVRFDPHPGMPRFGAMGRQP